MKRKHIYKIINEEIEGFDYLGMEESRDEQIDSQVFASKEFQVAFVKDIISNNTANISDIKVLDRKQKNDSFDTNIDSLYVDIDVNLDIELNYKYLGKSIPLVIMGDGFATGTMEGNTYKGDYHNEPQYPELSDNIDYSTVDLSIHNEYHGEISIAWLEKDSKLKNRFIKGCFSLGGGQQL